MDQQETYVAYTGVVLTEEARAELLRHVGWRVPPEYKRFAHHMTVCMGTLDLEKYPSAELGKSYILQVVSFGLDGRAAAVGVKSDLATMNAIPHITVGVNVDAGGKPKDSNDITDWQPFEFELRLLGVLTEVRVPKPPPRPKLPGTLRPESS